MSTSVDDDYTPYIYDYGYPIEYKIVEDKVKKIIPVLVYKFEYDAYGGVHGSNPLWTSQFQHWRLGEESTWLMKHRVGDIKLFKYVNPDTYSDMMGVVVKLYEEHAVYHALKWR